MYNGLIFYVVLVIPNLIAKFLRIPERFRMFTITNLCVIPLTCLFLWLYSQRERTLFFCQQTNLHKTQERGVWFSSSVTDSVCRVYVVLWMLSHRRRGQILKSHLLLQFLSTLYGIWYTYSMNRYLTSPIDEFSNFGSPLI